MIPNCPHCGEPLKRIYNKATVLEYANIEEDVDDLTATFHHPPTEISSGPHCNQCGGCVSGTLDDRGVSYY